MSPFMKSRQLPDMDKPDTEQPDTEQPDTDQNGEEGAPGVARVVGRVHPGVARVAARVLTGLAAVLVLLALLLPNNLTDPTVSAFLRIPVEGIVAAAVLPFLPPRARRVVAIVAGAVLGLVTILKFLDIGFYNELDRPFDARLDWFLLDDAEAFLRDSGGQALAVGAVIGVILIVAAVLVLMPLAVLRVSRPLVRHSTATLRTTAVLAVAWITCAALGTQIAGAPVASRSTGELVYSHVKQARDSLRDERQLAKAAAVDPFGKTPPDQLLTGLRGKDVIFAFIESYGRSAIEDPSMAPQIDAMLADNTSKLRAAGFSSRSAFLTSPTAGGGSWLAHSTFLSGLWITNQRSYETVTSGDRMTLTGAFQRADAWRTVGIMPGVTRAWPEGKFFGLDNIYDSKHLGYQGPSFGWSRMPDQFVLESFERLEHGKPGPKPLMSEIILTSSHNPWAPLPTSVGWDQVGDGSVYDAIHAAGKDPHAVLRSTPEVRGDYADSVEYSVNSLVSYVTKYGHDNTVLVFLGDHQPIPKVAGDHASRDVPIAIVAHDPAVLDKIAPWGWQDGLRPGPHAPVWRMDSFRNRFLTAYGPQPAAGAGPSPSAP
ncbi:sulfatase [Streptomyces sp. AcH 505]|uniref:sulfatase n=1 Tax=Streptomyces sp. AcH 505 TaxID=352211 RepID=UPI000A661263